MVVGCSPWLPSDGQCGYNMTIVTPNGIFVRKTLIPEQNLDATVQVSQKQNGMLPQSSSGYATGATSTGATSTSTGGQATGQLPSSNTPLPGATGADLLSISTILDVIPGKTSSSDPDSVQVNPSAILPSEDSGATLTNEIDSPQQPRNQHHPPPTGEPPPGYEFPKEETVFSTTTADTADSITVAVTHKEDIPPPFDGLAPKRFYHNDEPNPLRSSSSDFAVISGSKTQLTSSQLPMAFTTLSSPPLTPTSHKCRFFDDEVSGDSGFGSMASTNQD